MLSLLEQFETVPNPFYCLNKLHSHTFSIYLENLNQVSPQESCLNRSSYITILLQTLHLLVACPSRDFLQLIHIFFVDRGLATSVNPPTTCTLNRSDPATCPDHLRRLVTFPSLHADLIASNNASFPSSLDFDSKHLYIKFIPILTLLWCLAYHCNVVNWVCCLISERIYQGNHTISQIIQTEASVWPHFRWLHDATRRQIDVNIINKQKCDIRC